MTIGPARQLLKAQADFGGLCNANSARLILSEVQKKHGQDAVDNPIGGLDLQRIFGFGPGARFEGGLSIVENNINGGFGCRFFLLSF